MSSDRGWEDGVRERKWGVQRLISTYYIFHLFKLKRLVPPEFAPHDQAYLPITTEQLKQRALDIDISLDESLLKLPYFMDLRPSTSPEKDLARHHTAVTVRCKYRVYLLNLQALHRRSDPFQAHP